MLDEFCLNTGYHRKYAIRLLNGPPPGKRAEARRRGRKPQYRPRWLRCWCGLGSSGISVVGAVEGDLPAWMPWIRKRYKPSAETERQLLSISARQMDRRLAGKKSQCQQRLYGQTKPGTLLKHHIPVKTDSWNVTTPGYAEIDLVSHSATAGRESSPTR